ncbi:DoxX family protein [Nocardiopsis sp. EMB25]|uniref:DoxX family protein n=1 Tax=Nocardiopsis TaxID=2013 RepID=UPI00034A5A06|nr:MULTISPECIES: DoxX family protein [Nocardiopsis]MCY9787021.1 DoxX family protein [Nocardiopsis sp. EMB25]
MSQQSSGLGISDFTSLLARLVVGGVFVYHGWPKLADPGATAEGFAMMGVPMPEVAAVVGGLVEVGGGIALIIGFLLPLAGILLALQMIGAYVFAHAGQAFAEWELVPVIGAAALALGFAGGRFALDRIMPWGRRSRSDREA